MSQEHFIQANKAAESFQASLEETQESAFTHKSMLENQMVASREKLQDEAAENTSIYGAISKARKVQPKKEVKTEKAKQAQESVLIRPEEASDLADQFSGRQGNREYRLDILFLSELAKEIGTSIHEDSNPEDLILLLRKRMTARGISPDAAFIDKAFEFLLEALQTLLTKATEVDKNRLQKISKKIELAKSRHFDANAGAIQVARQIIGAVDSVAQTTGQTVKQVLDYYRDMVHNPPDLQALRKYYQTKGYKFMVLELNGLNSYLNVNFKDGRIENAALATLARSAKMMQTLFGVFNQFKNREVTLREYLKSNGIIETAAAA